MPDNSQFETSDTYNDPASMPTDGQAPDEIEPVMVTMSFLASDPDQLLSVLSNYVVMARNVAGCRNMDLVASTTKPGRYLVVQKWQDAESQQQHFDSPLMVDMATSCQGLLAAAPDIDLHDAVTMHDLN